MEAHTHMKWYSLLQTKCHSLLTMATKHTLFVANARKVWSMKIQEIPYKRSPDTDETVLCYPDSLPHYWPMTNKLSTFVSQAEWVLGVMFQEIPSIESWDTKEKVLWPPSKMPLLTDLSQQNLLSLMFMHGNYKIWSIRKVPGMEDEIHTKRYLVLQMMCSSLLNDCN